MTGARPSFYHLDPADLPTAFFRAAPRAKAGNGRWGQPVSHRSGQTAAETSEGKGSGKSPVCPKPPPFFPALPPCLLGCWSGRKRYASGLSAGSSGRSPKGVLAVSWRRTRLPPGRGPILRVCKIIKSVPGMSGQALAAAGSGTEAVYGPKFYNMLLHKNIIHLLLHFIW